MIGYCGIDCTACRAYQGTVKADMTLLEQAAGTWEVGVFSAKDWACLGCRPADQPFLAKYCAGCKVRVCAIERGLSNCAACADYEACPRLGVFMKTEPEALTRMMNLLRERFLDRGKGIAQP